MWRRLLTDPRSGALLELGRTTYVPPTALAEHVRVRDVTCRFPGCRRPAVGCDLDHTRRYPDGPTCPCNLAALCRHHHRLKHEAGWSVSQDERVLAWTSPTGHIARIPRHADIRATAAVRATARSSNRRGPSSRQEA
jgi:hypothetical protein